jgi:hypothetical protein
MSSSPKIIPFRILLRLFPRAIALLRRIIAARAAKWVPRNSTPERPPATPEAQPELTRQPPPSEPSGGRAAAEGDADSRRQPSQATPASA